MLELALYKELETTSGLVNLAIQFSLDEGALLAIYGKSGVGKTTLLRMIAGLATADSGHIQTKGAYWYHAESRINLTAQQRKVGFVFQDYALFPNMTIRENLYFANPNKQLIEEVLKQVELESLQNKKPQQLSGGQQQRVALARALVMQPTFLLLDEPLSALDNELRQNMQELIAKLHQTHGMTTLMVSHDIPEITALATKLLVLEGDRAVLYDQPIDYFKEQQLLQEIIVEGIVQEMKGTVIQLKVGTQQIRVSLSLEQLKEIKIGDQIKVKSIAMQTTLIQPKK